MIAIDTDTLSEEEIEAVLNSRGFQKMLLYRRLADGTSVLRDHDQLLDAMVTSITNQHAQVDSEEVTREFLRLFYREIQAFTEPLEPPAGGPTETADEAMISSVSDQRRPTDAELAVRDYLESKLEDTEVLELRANEIATDLNLESTHVGGILGTWRAQNGGPFDISATEQPGGSNLWSIKHPQ